MKIRRFRQGEIAVKMEKKKDGRTALQADNNNPSQNGINPRNNREKNGPFK